MNKALTIIILNHNQRSDTLSCIQSMDELLEDDGVEIIVVDNGSEESEIPYFDNERIQLLKLERNLGVACGRNAGLRMASGEKIMFLDNDTIVNSKAIYGLMDYMDKHPSCGIIAPRLLYPDGRIQQSYKKYPGIVVKLSNIAGLKKQVEEEITEVIHPCYVMGACQLFRASLIEQIGLQDENIFYGPEDADFCLRTVACGLTVDYVPWFSIIHNHRKKTRRALFSRLSQKHLKALIYFYFKYRRFF